MHRRVTPTVVAWTHKAKDGVVTPKKSIKKYVKAVPTIKLRTRPDHKYFANSFNSMRRN